MSPAHTLQSNIQETNLAFALPSICGFEHVQITLATMRPPDDPTQPHALTCAPAARPGAFVVVPLIGNPSVGAKTSKSVGGQYLRVVPDISALNLAWNTHALRPDVTSSQTLVEAAQTLPQNLPGVTSNASASSGRSESLVPLIIALTICALASILVLNL